MKYILFVLSIFLVVPISAQSLQGRLVDSENIPVPFANIITMTADSVFVAGTVSNDDGTFQITAGEDVALLKVSYIGYQEVVVPVAGKTDVGIIRLQEESTLLGEVEIKGTLPVTRIKGDAMVTSIENTVLSKVGSANDVLSKIPGLVLKKSGTENVFEVLGKGEPLIYINGREVRNQSELEQLNSDEIKSVELITNPGARYDASVKAVVRIQTVKRQGDGFGFDVRSSYIQSENTDAIGLLNFNYRHNNFDLFGTVNYNHYKIDYNSDVEYTRDVYNQNWKQTNLINADYSIDNIDAIVGMNYSFNENHSIGARYNISSYLKYRMDSRSLTELHINGLLDDRLDVSSFTNDDYKPGHQFNAYYNGKINDWTIDFNADYFQESYETESLDDEDSESAEDRVVRSLNPVNNKLAAGKLIVAHPLFGGSISFGSEYTYSYQRNDYLSASEEYVPTSYGKIQEHNIAVFAEYNRNFSFGQAAIGIRYEHVDFDYYEDLVYSEDESREYDNFFPNASFSTKLGPVQTQLSYTAKTERPSYWSLRKNVTYFNRFSLQTGDPTLKPTIIHDVTLTSSWRFLQFVASYQHQKDRIVPWGSEMESNPEIILFYPFNYDKIPQFNAYISAAPSIGIWSPTLTVGVTKQWVDFDIGNAVYDLDKPQLNGSFTNILSFPKGFVIGADLVYTGKGSLQNAYFNRNIWICNVSIRKTFLNDALEIEARGNDLFKQYKSSRKCYLGEIELNQIDTSDSREFVLTLRYRFNMTPSKYKGTGAGEEQKSRF